MLVVLRNGLRCSVNSCRSVTGQSDRQRGAKPGMILDFLLENVPLQWTTQVAIVGAGPTGLTLARELAKVAQVLIIEAGGIEPHREQEELLKGECVGIPYPLTKTRARQFGGSSGLWAGYCAQFDPHDFAIRDWVPGSGWPFGVEAIQPYYSRVADLLNLDEPNFDASHFARCSGAMLPFDRQAFTPTVWRFGTPTQRFGESLREEFATSNEITTLINANVADIRIDADHSTVTELIIRASNGREGRVAAHLFILACGGIETPRLLLNADTQVRHGLGNSNGMVGRCFMEHPHRCIDPLLIERRDWFENWTQRVSCDGDRQFTFCLGLSGHVQESAKVMNARAHVYRTPEMLDDDTPKVGLFLEQAPNPESRVMLSSSTDSFGVRRVRLNWQLSDLDWTTYKSTASLIAEEFERIGAGRLTGPIGQPAQSRDQVLYSNHHLGTTRMADTREHGVVDSHCRVHDLSNLYVIGGSIFPTVSWANPTFTLIALTFRLADRLKRSLNPNKEI